VLNLAGVSLDRPNVGLRRFDEREWTLCTTGSARGSKKYARRFGWFCDGSPWRARGHGRHLGAPLGKLGFELTARFRRVDLGKLALDISEGGAMDPNRGVGAVGATLVEDSLCGVPYR
jgi:hypothetical protein